MSTLALSTPTIPWRLGTVLFFVFLFIFLQLQVLEGPNLVMDRQLKVKLSVYFLLYGFFGHKCKAEVEPIRPIGVTIAAGGVSSPVRCQGPVVLTTLNNLIIVHRCLYDEESGRCS